MKSLSDFFVAMVNALMPSRYVVILTVEWPCGTRIWRLRPLLYKSYLKVWRMGPQFYQSYQKVWRMGPRLYQSYLKV